MIINGKRALAHIERVTNIREIPGADNIEQCSVLGWNLICKKGEFKENGVCVYIEIDSKCPADNPEFEFLANKGYKVKTMKLSKFGVVSQGLALPATVLTLDMVSKLGYHSYESLIGNYKGPIDVTDLLGITYAVAEDNKRKASEVDPEAKYISMKARHRKLFKNKFIKFVMRYKLGRKIMFFFFGKKKDNPKGFPSFISKTDEERVENQPWRCGDGKTYLATEKLDGTSSTYVLERVKKNKYEFYVCSRNVRQKDENQACYHDHNIYWDMAFKYDVEKHLREFLKDNSEARYVCIQGEAVGSVQGNPLKLKEDDLYIFNFIDSIHGRISSESGKTIIESWGMNWVPMLGTVTIPDSMEELKALAEGKSVVNPEVLREGIVYRSLDGKDSFKNVSIKYLLKHNI